MTTRHPTDDGNNTPVTPVEVPRPVRPDDDDTGRISTMMASMSGSQVPRSDADVFLEAVATKLAAKVNGGGGPPPKRFLGVNRSKWVQMLFAVALAVWYARRYNLGFAPLADAYAPGLALGHAIGRLGCFSAGCCWGKPTDAAWAVTFTNPYSSDLVGVPLGIPLHPTQLYESVAEAFIFLLLVWLWRRRRFSGQIFAAYLMLYSVARFLNEFFRNDPRGGFLFDGALSVPQAFSIALFAVAGLFFWVQRSRSAAAAHAV